MSDFETHPIGTGKRLAELEARFDADALRAELSHMTEARDNARAEVERLTAKLNAIEADDDKLSIMFGWLVYDVGECTCGGYGPESGYAHEPGCGFEPVLRLDEREGWPGEKPQGDRDALTDERDSLSWQVEALRAERDARSSERDALAAKVERVRALADLIDRHTEFERDPVDFRDASHGGSWDDVADRIRRALDEEPQP